MAWCLHVRRWLDFGKGLYCFIEMSLVLFGRLLENHRLWMGCWWDMIFMLLFVLDRVVGRELLVVVKFYRVDCMGTMMVFVWVLHIFIVKLILTLYARGSVSNNVTLHF